MIKLSKIISEIKIIISKPIYLEKIDDSNCGFEYCQGCYKMILEDQEIMVIAKFSNTLYNDYDKNNQKVEQILIPYLDKNNINYNFIKEDLVNQIEIPYPQTRLNIIWKN